MIKTPQLEKMKAVRDQSQMIGEFLDYMEQRDFVLCEPNTHDGSTHEACYLPVRKSKEELLAFFFEVDLVEAEKERQALLDSIRN